MSKCIICTLSIFLSCLKFEFESPYEDLNGIYLQLVKSYDYSGKKLIIEGQNGYILYEPLTAIMKYNFSNIDSIYMTCYYINGYEVSDFEISNDFAYEALHYYGLRIIDFEDSEPTLSGELEISGGAELVRLYNNYIYLASDNNFYIIDVSDKTNPQKIGEFNFDYDVSFFEIDSDYAYVLMENGDFCILDIREPDDIERLYQTETESYHMFALNGKYLHFLSYFDQQISTYEIIDSCAIEFVSSISVPGQLYFIYANDKYGLVFDCLQIYLLNLEYPSRPCISEMMNKEPGYGNCGIIDGSYIYVLTPQLNIIEIKEVSE